MKTGVMLVLAVLVLQSFTFTQCCRYFIYLQLYVVSVLPVQQQL